MPLYDYRCPHCGTAYEVFKPLAQLDRVESCITCETAMERQLSAPRVVPDYAPYTCPITGKMIAGRVAHRENLAAHGCRLYEPGEKEAAQRFRQKGEDALTKDIDATVEAEIHAMPTVKREQLAADLQHGFSAETIRT